MNYDQVTGTLRIIVPLFLTYAVSHNWLPASEVVDATTAIFAIAAVVWGIFAHSQTNSIRKVAGMEAVHAVVLQPTEEGKTLAAAVGSTPAATVKVATL
jgi:hypothetical protein